MAFSIRYRFQNQLNSLISTTTLGSQREVQMTTRY
jgi:hypothetical protein